MAEDILSCSRPRAHSPEHKLELVELRAQGLKRCYCCEQIKSANAFSVDRSRSDGRQPRCKSCHDDYLAKNKARITLQKHGMAPTFEQRYPGGVHRCQGCECVKSVNEFFRFAIPRDTLRSICDSCQLAKDVAWRQAETARKMAWKRANSEWSRAYERNWARANPEKRAAYKQRYMSKHREKVLAKIKAKRASNRDEMRRRERERYKLNKSDIRARKRLAYAANAEAERARHKRYREEHPEIKAAHWRNRRARKNSAEGFHTAADIERLMELQRGMCASAWCRKKLRRGFHVDHVIPLSKGGSNWISNLQLLCPLCNLRKSAKHPIDFAQENGLLL